MITFVFSEYNCWRGASSRAETTRPCSLWSTLLFVDRSWVGRVRSRDSGLSARPGLGASQRLRVPKRGVCGSRADSARSEKRRHGFVSAQPRSELSKLRPTTLRSARISPLLPSCGRGPKLSSIRHRRTVDRGIAPTMVGVPTGRARATLSSRSSTPLLVESLLEK